MERQKLGRLRAVEFPDAGSNRRHPQSFSSSLLDAIYRSIDEVPMAPASSGGIDFEGSSGRHRPLTASPCYAWRPRAAAEEKNPRWRPRGLRNDQRYDCGVERKRTADRLTLGVSRRMATGRGELVNNAPAAGTTSSFSSDLSGYSGHSIPSSVRRTERETERSNRRAKPPPSPGARLASFFGSLFPARSPRLRKQEAAGGGKRGGAGASSGAGAITSASAAAREARWRAEEAVAARRRMAAVAAVEEEDDVASDSSSDLFELADLTVDDDELPVYGRTAGKGSGRTAGKGSGTSVASGFSHQQRFFAKLLNEKPQVWE